MAERAADVAARDRRGAIGVALLALAILVFAVWRATLGLTFSDDGHYTAMAMRLASGARPFTDERNVQALGFLVSIPFTKLWLAAVGTSYLALALRLYYVVLAAIVGCVAYLCVRPSFGRLASAVGIGAVLLAPPYSLLEVSYNTSSMLALIAAAALGFAAVRDRRRNAAVASAALLAFASISYPPLVLAAVAVFLSTLLLGDREVMKGMVAGGLVATAVIVLGLAATTSLAEIRATLAFASSGLQNVHTPMWELHQVLLLSWDRILRLLVPLWALAAVATMAPWRRLRTLAAASLPLAAVLPGALRIVGGGDRRYFGVYPSAFLVVFMIAALLPVVAANARRPSSDLTRLLVLTLPSAAVGYVVVAVTTNSGPYWGMPIVGVAPLALTVVIGWVGMVRSDMSGRIAVVASVALLLVLVALLAGTVFKRTSPLALDSRLATGPYAGLAIDRGRASAIRDLTAAGQKWVRPDATVFVIAGPGIYPIVGGRAYTPALWDTSGPQALGTIEYFDERRAWPDVAFINLPQPALVAPKDPLVRRIEQDYRRVDEVAGFTIFVRR